MPNPTRFPPTIFQREWDLTSAKIAKDLPRQQSTWPSRNPVQTTGASSQFSLTPQLHHSPEQKLGRIIHLEDARMSELV
jgi:hypothetical protein